MGEEGESHMPLDDELGGAMDENESDLLDPEQRYVPKKQKTSAFHCKACKKSFKSEEQLQNHCESKKHKQAMKELERANR